MQKVLTFLKRHYEKLVFCLVLIGLGVAGFMLPQQLQAVKDTAGPPANPSEKSGQMAPFDFGPLAAAMQQVTNPPALALSGEHNLFNPVVWKRKSNGDLIKALKTGADALVVSNIVPQYERIGLDHPSGEVFAMYVQGPSGKKTNEYVKVSQKSKSGLYEIVGTNGAGDDVKLQLQLLDTGERVDVTEKQPYERVESHIADLWYPPDSKPYAKQHVSDTLTLDGEPYKIVAITNDAVTVEQSSTTHRTTIAWKGKPEAGRRP